MLDGIAEPLTDGSWVSQRLIRLVEIIREEYPNLEVTWIPREKRGHDDPAFAIIETLADGREVVAFYIQDEAAFNESILERIIRSDMRNKDPQKVLNEWEARAAAEKLIVAKKQREQMDEIIEPYAYALKSGKHKYTGDSGRLHYDY